MSKKQTFNWLKTLLLLGIAVAVLYFGYPYWQRRQATGPTFLSTPATRGDLLQTVTATGQLNPVVNVQIGSQISGIIQKLNVDFNSQVKAGQVIAQIDPATYEASVIQAEGELASAKAALELARLVAERTKGLRAQNSAPQASVDKAMADLHQAEAMVKIKEGAMAKVKVDLARCTIFAPIDGIVISRNVDVGQTVAASLTAPVLFIIANDLTKMQIDANIAEADIGAVALDQLVDFSVDAYPRITFRGKVVQLRKAPIVQQNIVMYDSVIAVNNDDLRLNPGMTANVSILVTRRDNALKIANAALRFRPPEGWPVPPPVTAAKSDEPASPQRSSKHGGKEKKAERIVYVVNDPKDTPQPVQIKIGISDGAFTEVVEGLKEGDQVVIGLASPGAISTPAGNPLTGGKKPF